MWNILGTVNKGDYVYAIVHDHPNAIQYGYVLLHRVVMENHIGRLLTCDEVVHHIDHNGHNNDISNLELMTVVEHNLLHAGEQNISYFLLQCPNCGYLFYRPCRQTFWIKRTNHYTACSRSCSGQFGRYLQIHGLDEYVQSKLETNIVGHFIYNENANTMLEI